MYEFGYNIENIPPALANNVTYLLWKIEGASFDVSLIELKQIDETEENLTRIHLPDNLILSYEDLVLYGLSVSHLSKIETKIGNVTSKSEWFLDPIVFSGGIITITDYDTKGGACSHEDIYNAMQNSTFQKQGDRQYYSNARIVIGNGSGSTWFVDSSVQIEFNASVVSASYQNLYEVKTNAFLEFGSVIDNATKRTWKGVSVIFHQSIYHTIAFVHGSNVYVYSSHFNAGDYPYEEMACVRTNKRIWNCDFQNCYVGGTDLNMFNCDFVEGLTAIRRPTGGTYEKLRITTISYALYFYGLHGVTVSNLYVRNCSYLARAWDISADSYFIDFDTDTWKLLNLELGGTGEIYRQYSFDLVVSNATSGNLVQNANVTIYNAYLNQTWEFVTDASGEIPTQTFLLGHYNTTGGDVLYDYGLYELNITHGDYWEYRGYFKPTEKTRLCVCLHDPKPLTYGIWLMGILFIALIVSSCLIVALKYRKK